MGVFFTLQRGSNIVWAIGNARRVLLACRSYRRSVPVGLYIQNCTFWALKQSLRSRNSKYSIISTY